jgi:ferredoxin
VDPAVDPAIAFTAAVGGRPIPSGAEPLLAGALRQQAVWVDEAVCIGCRYCAHVAGNTFVVEPTWGRSRAIRQDGDSTERIQEAIDTCPVDCIHWVAYERLPVLQEQLRQQEIQPLGLPSAGARLKRTLPRRAVSTPS